MNKDFHYAMDDRPHIQYFDHGTYEENLPVSFVYPRSRLRDVSQPEHMSIIIRLDNPGCCRHYVFLI